MSNLQDVNEIKEIKEIRENSGADKKIRALSEISERKEVGKILEIYEADFGCEGRPDGQETMVMVCLKSEKSGLEHTIQIRDSYLDEKGICEGDLVCWAKRENGTIDPVSLEKSEIELEKINFRQIGQGTQGTRDKNETEELVEETR